MLTLLHKQADVNFVFVYFGVFIHHLIIVIHFIPNFCEEYVLYL